MYSQKTHPGNMPVRVLRYNIEERFSNIRDEVREMHEREKYQYLSEISIMIEKSPIKTPFVNLKDKKIYIQETYLSYLWTVCYYFLVVQEYIMFRQMQNNWNGHIEYNVPILQRAKNLFDWGISLREKYSDWDLSLPNPDFESSHFSKYEEEFIGKATNLFNTSVTYLLFHEYAHLVCGHGEVANLLRNKENLNDDERIKLKELEIDADNFAFDTIIKHYDDDLYREIKGLSIIYSHISNLFLLFNAEKLMQENHPDVDQRLINVLYKLDLIDGEKKYYLWSLSTLAINLFMNEHKIKIEQLIYETVEDMLTDYMNIIDKIKEK